MKTISIPSRVPTCGRSPPAADETVYLQYEFDGIYKLHEMLVWNYNVQWELILGFGVKNATVEYSVDGTDWIVLGDVELAQATAAATYEANTTVAFDGAAAKYVRLTVNSGYGSMGQYGLSEVRFMYIPAQAREPQPADGAAGRGRHDDPGLACRSGMPSHMRCTLVPMLRPSNWRGHLLLPATVRPT